MGVVIAQEDNVCVEMYKELNVPYILPLQVQHREPVMQYTPAGRQAGRQAAGRQAQRVTLMSVWRWLGK